MISHPIPYLTGNKPMSINLDRLRQFATQPQEKPRSIAELVHRLHRSPKLRELIALETVAFPPIPVLRKNQWHLLALLSRPLQPSPQLSTWLAPWGVVEWSWPEAEVVQILDIRQVEPFQTLRKTTPNASIPTKTSLFSEREATLFTALEAYLTPENTLHPLPTELSQYYADLLPPEFFPYYHALVPDSQAWLLPQSDDSTTTQAASSSPTSIPTPLSGLSNGLSQALELAQAYRLETIATELKSLQSLLHKPGFRLAVVGEFSRGKSTLINRLLARDLLPEGAPPTTSTLVSITAGTEEGMTLEWPNHQSESRSLALESWADVLATQPDGSSREVTTPIQMVVDHDWLRSLDTELIDTPGAGDLSDQRAVLVTDVLNQCDAALMVVSATYPVSLTEQSFLETQVLGRHIPRVIVGVSKLDTIPVAERVEVFDLIRQRIARISSALPVFPLHALTEAESHESAIMTLRTALEQMSNQDDRRLWRDRQIANRLGDALQQIQDLSTAGLKTLKLSQAERQKEIQRQETAIAQADTQWQMISLEFKHRRLQLESNLRQRLFSPQAEWREALHYDLSRTPEPKTWWERDLPFRLRRDLATVTRQAEGFVLKTIAQDTDWLKQAITQQFGQPWAEGDRPDLKEDLEPILAGLSLVDTQRYRLLTRLGSSAAVVCGYLLGGPIGIVASTSIWLVGEQIVNQKTTEQRQLLAQELDQRLDNAFDRYLSTVRDRLGQVYETLSQTLIQTQQTWQTERHRLLEMPPELSEPMDWQACIDTAIALEALVQKESQSVPTA
jgi:GTPase SAR1 family protein